MQFPKESAPAASPAAHQRRDHLLFARKESKFYIDTHKGATIFFCLILASVYNQWDNPTAMVYTAIHGANQKQTNKQTNE